MVKNFLTRVKNIRILEYNKFPLPEFRYGMLPLNVKLLLGVSENHCENDFDQTAVELR